MRRTRKSVICVETGKYYENYSSAAKAIRSDVASIGQSVKGGYKANGFTFRFLTKSDLKNLENITENDLLSVKLGKLCSTEEYRDSYKKYFRQH